MKTARIFIFVLFTFVSLHAQLPDSVVAKIGTTNISLQEFRQRFELSPHFGLQQFDSDSLKNSFFASLIAEKLLSQEAAELGYDTLPAVKSAMLPITSLYYKDALYQAVIKRNASVTEEELQQGVMRLKETRLLRILSSEDSSEIYELYSRLNAGVQFDSLLLIRPEAGMQITPIRITFGQLEEIEIENVVYALQMNNYSTPQKTADGYFIFKLIGIENTPIPNASDIALRNKLADIIGKRKEKNLYRQYVGDFLKDKVLETSEKAVFSVFNTVLAQLQSKAASGKIDTTQAVCLEEPDLFEAAERLPPDTLAMTLFTIDGSPRTIADFFGYLRFTMFCIDEINTGSVVSAFNNYLRAYIEQELFAAEAVRLGLTGSPEIRLALSSWKENLTAQYYINRLIDPSKVTDKQVKEYYEKITAGDEAVRQLKVALFTTSNLTVIEAVLDRVKKGERFNVVALSLKKDSTVSEALVTDFTPVTRFAEIGGYLTSMGTEEIYGPVQTKKGYSLFQILDERNAVDTVKVPFNEVREKIRLDLLMRTFESDLRKKVVSLADKYGLEVNTQALASLQTTTVNTYMYRMMGFGGRIAAVPQTKPFFRWFPEWIKTKKIGS